MNFIFNTLDGLLPDQNESVIREAFELFGEVEEVGRKSIYIPDDIVIYFKKPNHNPHLF